jgi:hypothetical protein
LIQNQAIQRHNRFFRSRFFRRGRLVGEADAVASTVRDLSAGRLFDRSS